MIGYFPTYALGNMYAAQFFDRRIARPARSQSAAFARGEFASLKTWLNDTDSSPRQALPGTKTGRAGDEAIALAGALVRHLHQKFDELYGL